MKCKKHCTDLSSIDGVCASCLRERLFRVIRAQEEAEAQSKAQNQCISDTNPPCQSSASPYTSCRKFDNSVALVAPVQGPYNKPPLNHSLSDRRFHNSPQIAFNTRGCIGDISSHRKKQSLIKFSSFSNMFRSNNRNGDADSVNSVSVSTSTEPCGASGNPTSLASSPSWFSIVGRQKKKASNVDDSPETAMDGVVRKQRFVRDRGMSPARSSDDGGEDDFSDGSIDFELLETESSKQTPQKTPSRNSIRRGGRQKSASEILFCLSPLVRAKPNRLCSLKGKPPLDVGFSGDTRPPPVPNLSCTKSFCANRSRKIADFGRSDPNRR